MHTHTHKMIEMLLLLAPQENTTLRSKMCTAPHAHAQNDWKCRWRHKKTPRYDPKCAPRHTYTPWSALRVRQRRSALLLVLATSCMRQKNKKRNDDEAHPETGATSGHSRRCMQPKQKHNDNAKPLKKPNKKRQETHAHIGPCCQ